MDKINESTQDPLPGKGLASGSGDEITSHPPAPPKETYSRAEHEAEINKVSDVMAEQGRKLKTLETDRDTKAGLLTQAEERLTTVSANLEKLQDRLDELEEKGLSGSPEGLSLLEQRRLLRKQQREHQTSVDAFAKEKSTHAEELRIAKEDRFERQVIEAAYESKVDAVKLKALCQEFKLTTEEQIRKQAQAIVGSAGSGQGAGGVKPGDTSSLHVDSAKGAGGGKDFSKLSPDELIKEGLSKQRNK